MATVVAVLCVALVQGEGGILPIQERKKEGFMQESGKGVSIQDREDGGSIQEGERGERESIREGGKGESKQETRERGSLQDPDMNLIGSHRNASLLDINKALERFWRGCPGSPGRCRGRDSLAQREWESDVALLRERLVMHHDQSANERFGNPVRGVSLLPFHSSEAHQRRISVRAALASQQSQSALPVAPPAHQPSMTHPTHTSPSNTNTPPSGANSNPSHTPPFHTPSSGASNNRCTPTQCPTLSRCPHTPHLDISSCQAPRAQPPWDLTSALVLRDVFVNNEGVVYNASTIFDFGDCTLGAENEPQVRLPY